jgi:hypothetical protein
MRVRRCVFRGTASADRIVVVLPCNHGFAPLLCHASPPMTVHQTTWCALPAGSTKKGFSFLTSSSSPSAQLQELASAVRARNVEISLYPVRKPEDIAPAREAGKAAGAEAVNFLASALFSIPTRKASFAKALALGMPATPVAKMLRGEYPGELPVEQPTKIVLAINLGIAQQISGPGAVPTPAVPTSQM